MLYYVHLILDSTHMPNTKPKKKGSLASLAQGLAVGAALGALVGILFAPKKGSETRKDIEEAFYKVKADVAKRLVKAKKVSEVQYRKAVQEAVKVQAKVKKTLKKADWDGIEDRLVSGWKDIAKTVGKMTAPLPAKKKRA